MSTSVEQAMLDWLRAEGYTARKRPEASDKGELVTVEKTSSTTENMVETATVAVQTWAASEARAEDMANAIRLKLLTSSAPRGIKSVRCSNGPYPFWDTEAKPKRPRYQTVYSVTSII